MSSNLEQFHQHYCPQSAVVTYQMENEHTTFFFPWKCHRCIMVCGAWVEIALAAGFLVHYSKWMQMVGFWLATFHDLTNMPLAHTPLGDDARTLHLEHRGGGVCSSGRSWRVSARTHTNTPDLLNLLQNIGSTSEQTFDVRFLWMKWLACPY